MGGNVGGGFGVGGNVGAGANGGTFSLLLSKSSEIKTFYLIIGGGGGGGNGGGNAGGNAGMGGGEFTTFVSV